MKAKIIITILLLSLLYIGYLVIQDNSIKYTNEQHKVDSLIKEIVKLDSQQVKKDSVIIIYKDSVVYVDSAIKTEKTKYIYIKNKYNEIHNRIIRYTPTQLDSFFSARYGH
jgi:hypothetical protein